MNTKKCSHCGKKVRNSSYVAHETIGFLDDVAYFHRACFSKVYGFKSVKEFAQWMEERNIEPKK